MQVGPNDILVADRIYIPVRFVNSRRVKHYFERRLFDEKKCRRCQVFKDGDRYSHEICGPCVNHKGFFVTWAHIRLNGIDYIAVPSGNTRYVAKALNINFRNFRIHDLRADIKAQFPLTFTKQLYDGSIVNNTRTVDQRKVLRDYTKYNRGLLVARARSGKTVMAVRLICYMKRRVIVIAHEMELLNQFYRTLLNMTNMKQLEARTGRKLAGIVKSPQDLIRSHNEKWDIVLTTYQRFIKEKTGIQQLNAYVRGQFGVAIVDEVHRGNANTYAIVLGKIDPKYKIGLTATYKRKDRKEFLIDQIIGPVVAQAESVGMTPIVTLHDTEFSLPYEPKGMTAYGKITRMMAEDQKRNALLVKHVFNDLRANPNHNIIIPVLYVDHAHRLATMINRYAMYLNDTKGENWDLHLAMPYHAKSNKEQVLAAARDATKTRVIIGIRSKISEGIDVLTWTHMYCQFPMNNSENFYQMSNRILTPAPNKPQPFIRFFIDNVGLSLGCFVATWYNGVLKYKYAFDKQTQNKALHYENIKDTKIRGKGKPKFKALTGKVGSSW